MLAPPSDLYSYLGGHLLGPAITLVKFLESLLEIYMVALHTGAMLY